MNNSADRSKSHNNRQREDGLKALRRNAAHELKHPVNQMRLLLGMRAAEIGKCLFRQEHNVGGDKKHGQNPGKGDPYGHKDTKDLHRRDRRERKRKKTGNRGQRRKKHGAEQFPKNQTNRFLTVIVTGVFVKELA